MICSACGYENQGQMRYCVMCGMPLPHRPMTTPGAQSTLNFTRIPVESDSTHDQGRSVTGSSTTGVLEPSSGNGSTGRTNAVTLPGAIAPVESAPMVDEAPPPELVPDVSWTSTSRSFITSRRLIPAKSRCLGMRLLRSRRTLRACRSIRRAPGRTHHPSTFSSVEALNRRDQCLSPELRQIEKLRRRIFPPTALPAAWV